MRKLWCDASRGVLELEAVAEHQVVSLASVLAEVFVELRRRLRFDVADLGAERVADLEQPPVGPGIPRLVGHRPRCEERHPECVCAVGNVLLPVTASHIRSKASERDQRGEQADTRWPEQSNPFHVNALRVLWTRCGLPQVSEDWLPSPPTTVFIGLTL